MKKRYLILILLIFSFLSLFVGVSNISPLDLLDYKSEETEIFLISRLPRLIAIILAGAGMGIAGLIMQQLSRNKFVSPTTAGTWMRPALAFLFRCCCSPMRLPLPKWESPSRLPWLEHSSLCISWSVSSLRMPSLFL